MRLSAAFQRARWAKRSRLKSASSSRLRRVRMFLLKAAVTPAASS
jgi:hypothetical protein